MASTVLEIPVGSGAVMRSRRTARMVMPRDSRLALPLRDIS